jgi:probable LLM family oxidoreductase
LSKEYNKRRNMEIGIDSFAKKTQTNEGGTVEDDAKAMSELIERIVHADKVGLDVFGLGEHHREEFLDSAAHNILSAAAAKTENIRLTSAVAVISAMDPVRLFQNYATLDLISNGRAEIVAGRGSFTEAFPLFGLDFNDYDDLYAEKLDLLLRIRDEKEVTWSGKFRPPLENQTVYPRPLQERLPVWIGVGGTPASFIRAGTLGLPLMVAVIGGETHRFRPLIDMYYEAAEKAGHDKGSLKVGLHSLGFVANSKEEAIERYYPGYRIWFNQIGKERGWPPVTMERFEQQIGDLGAYVIGSPEEVAEKLLRHSEALGGISRFTFQIDNAGLTHEDLLESYSLIGKKVKPLVLKNL